MCFQPVMPNSVMPDSVMLNSYLMLYHIPLYHFPLYLIPDCPLECYNRFLFSVIPDSIISDSVIPDSCFDIPDSVMPNSVIPDSSFACYNRFRYTRFPAPGGNTCGACCARASDIALRPFSDRTTQGRERDVDILYLHNHSWNETWDGLGTLISDWFVRLGMD